MVPADSGKNHKLVCGCLKLRKPWPSLMVSKCVLRNHPGVQATEEPPRLLGEVGKVETGFQPFPSSHQGGSFFLINYCPSSHFKFWESLLLLQSKQNKAKINQTANPPRDKKPPTSQWSPCNNIVIQKKKQTGPEKERWEESQNLNPVLLTLCPLLIPSHWERDVWSFVGERNCSTDVWDTHVGANPDLHREAL